MNPRSRSLKLLLIAMALLPPTASAHVHIQVGYINGIWDLHVLDFESGRFAAGEYPFVVSSIAGQPVPSDSRYHPFLGPSGSVWILPQIESAGLLNLGIGTSGIGPGTFSGNLIRLELHGVHGPGDFALFTASPFGAPIAHWASRDGVDPESDVFTAPAVNGHVHVNWAFTEPGIYRLALAASATLAATGQITRSPLVDFTFIVEEPVRPRLEITRVHPDGSVELTSSAPEGTSVRIEVGTKLGEWVVLRTILATGQPQRVDVPQSPSDFRFFRAVLP